jgi:hypothetical protein
MDDDWIAKSIAYTINADTITMVAVTDRQMRFTPGITNFIEYNFIVLPSEDSPEQIRNLGDVARLGGKIMAVMSQGIPFPPSKPSTG